MNSKAHPIHPIFLSIAVFFVCLLLVFSAGEIYYRFFYDATDSFGLTKVTKRWFMRHYRANSINARDNIEYYLKPVPERRRVTFLGDSFTAAHGIKNIESRFANILRRKKQYEWEIHVLAKNGFDTGEEIELLKKSFAKGYSSDLVVLVYVLNDISDIIPEWINIHARIFHDVANEPFLVKHSFFVNTWYYRLRSMRDPDVANYYGFVKSAYVGPLWEIQKKRLAELQAVVENSGARLAVVTFPFLHRMGPDYEYREIHQTLDAFWKERGVAHLDLLETYDPYPSRKMTLNRFDAHPNEFAHRLAGEAMLKFLEECCHFEISPAGGPASLSLGEAGEARQRRQPQQSSPLAGAASK